MRIVGEARRSHIGDKRTKNHTFTRQNYKQRSIITPPTVKLCLTVKNLTFRRKCGQKWESGKRVGHICLGGRRRGLVGPMAAPAAWRPKCSKRGIVLTKKPRLLFFAPLQRDAHGGFSAEKPRNSRKMACNYSSHKAYGCANKAGECSPYGRNALNINKKGLFKGLLFHLHPKVNAKRWSGKRQKAWCRVV